MLADPQYRICFVCSGSICRAPIAETVVRALAERSGLGGIAVESAGTGDWHIGERPDLRTLRVLADHGYVAPTARARQFDVQWFDRLDLVVAFDRGHARTLRSWAPDEESLGKVRLMRGFDPALAAVLGTSAGPATDLAAGADLTAGADLAATTRSTHTQSTQPTPTQPMPTQPTPTQATPTQPNTTQPNTTTAHHRTVPRPTSTREGVPHVLDIPDPYYEDEHAFEVVLRLVEAAGAGLIEAVAEQLREPVRH